MLALQQLAGNQAVARIVQRWGTPTPFLDNGVLLDGTLTAFDSYAERRPDWANAPGLGPHHDVLRLLLAWARATDGVLAACGGLRVRDLCAGGLPEERRRNLAAYSLPDLVPLRTPGTPTLEQAVESGQAIRTLIATIPAATVARLVVDRTRFEALLNHVDRFADYWTAAGPTMDSTNGADVDGYLRMITEDGFHPNDWVGVIPNVRNYHRFTHDVLTGLRANYDAALAEPGALPLRLILYTSFDHNGAFTRHPHLLPVVNDPTHRTLLIEGVPSLEAMGDLVRDYARWFGQEERVAQVVLMGHGESRHMDLAGSVDAEGNRTDATSQSLDLRAPEAGTEAFLDRLVAVMRPADARIVINACLTGSSSYDPGAEGFDPTRDPREQVREALDQNPGIAARLRQVVTAARPEQPVDIRGALASIYPSSVALMDPTPAGAGLGLYPLAPYEDPDVGLPDPFRYIRTGIEVGGCLRAVVDTMSRTTVSGLPGNAVAAAAMRWRLAHPRADSWNEALIQAAYGLLAGPDAGPEPDIQLATRLAVTAGALSEGQYEPASSWSFWSSRLAAGPYGRLMEAVAATPRWAGMIRLAGLSMWAHEDDAMRADFIDALAATTAAAAAKVVYPNGAGWFARFLPDDAATATRGHFVLAFIGLNQNDADSRAFLLRAVPEPLEGAPADFPDTAMADAALGGLKTRQEVLVAIGRRGPAVVPAGEPEDNVALVGGGSIHVSPVLMQATTDDDIEVRAYPHSSGVLLGSLPEDTRVQIFGKIVNEMNEVVWWAIEHTFRGKRVTGFVRRHDGNFPVVPLI